MVTPPRRSILKYTLVPGITAAIATIACFLIVMIGPNDHEFGPSWVGPWKAMATPTALFLDTLHLNFIFVGMPRPLSLGLGVALVSGVNFVIAGLTGFFAFKFKNRS